MADRLTAEDKTKKNKTSSCHLHLSPLSACFPYPPIHSLLYRSSPSIPVTLTSSCSPQHLCPSGGGVPEKRKPPGQPGTSQMVSKLHLHYLSSSSLPLAGASQWLAVSVAPHIICQQQPLFAYKSSSYSGKLRKKWTEWFFYHVWNILV